MKRFDLMLGIPRPNYVRRRVEPNLKRRASVFTEAEVKAVLAHYQLGPWRLGEDLGGGDTDNILLWTGFGKKVLKRYRWPWPHPLVEQSLYWHLTVRQFPVPALVPNNAELTYTDVGGKIYSIFDFIEGFSLDNYFWWPVSRQCLVVQAAQLLARYHRMVVGFVPSGEKYDGFRLDQRRLYRDVDWHLAVLDRYQKAVAGKSAPDRLDAFVLRTLDQLEDDLVEVGRYYTQPGLQLPVLTVHGDYTPRNVIFRRDGSVVALDFSGACLNLRALDVARGLTAFAHKGRGGVDERQARVFLQAYNALESLSENEIAAIPALIRWRHLRNIVWRIHDLETQPERRSREASLAFIREKWEANVGFKTNQARLQEVLLSITG